MSNQLNLTDLMKVIEIINVNTVWDNRFENLLVSHLQNLDLEEKWFVVKKLLTHPEVKVRTMGLRIVRRTFRERILLERVIQLSFSVNRYAALKHWYKAILSRYSVTRFGSILCKEMEKQRDEGFYLRHLRALEMLQLKNNKTKKRLLSE